MSDVYFIEINNGIICSVLGDIDLHTSDSDILAQEFYSDQCSIIEVSIQLLIWQEESKLQLDSLRSFSNR